MFKYGNMITKSRLFLVVLGASAIALGSGNCTFTPITTKIAIGGDKI